MKKLNEFKGLMAVEPGKGKPSIGVIPDRGGLGFTVIPEDRDPTMTPKKIEQWAKANPYKGVELGRRLVEYRLRPEELQKLQSLGIVQDAIQTWAIRHPKKTRVLVIKMMPGLLKATRK